MAKWFCFTCMGHHSSEEEIQRCRAANHKPLTAEQIRETLDYVRIHNIVKADDKCPNP